MRTYIYSLYSSYCGPLKPFVHGGLLFLLGLAFLTLPKVYAGDAAWNVNSDGAWSNDSNWSPSSAPGSLTGTTSTDVATFGSVISSARTITVDSGRNIFGINFSGNSSAYSLTGGSILLTNGGFIQTSGAGTAHTDTISSAIILEGNGGAYTFSASSTTIDRALRISGSITGTSSIGGVSVLNLSGTGTSSNNLISGGMGDGGNGGVLSLVKSGSGNWTLSGANSFSGTVTVNEGQLTTNNSSSLNSANVVYVNSGATWATGANITFAGINDGVSGGGILTNTGAGARNFIVNGSGDYTFSGSINNGANATTFIMQGTGTQTLQGSSSAGIQANAGTLVLDFSAATAPSADIVSHGVAPAAAAVGGGHLILNGKAGATNSQSLGRLTVGTGSSTIELDAKTSNSLLLVFGNIQTRTLGGTIDFILPQGTQNSTNGILSTVGNVNGIIGGYATVGGTDWATSSAVSTGGVGYSYSSGNALSFSGNLANGTIISFNVGVPTGSGLNGGQTYYVINSNGSSFQLASTISGTALNATGSGTGTTTISTLGNITAYSSYTDFVGSGGGSGNYILTDSGSVTASEAFNSLKIVTTADNQSLDVGAQILTLTSGGLLFAGSNGYEIKHGTLKSAISGTSDLIIQQRGTGDLTISAVIANGNGASTLTKAGSGRLILTGINTFTGAANLNEGIVNFNSLSALGAGTSIVFSGGTLQYATGNTADISSRTVMINASGATIDTNGNDVTYSSAIGNSGLGGLTKTGSGTLTLNGANTYQGSTIVSGGTLVLNGANSYTGDTIINSSATLIVNGSTNVLSRVALHNGGSLGGSGTVSGLVTTSGTTSHILPNGTLTLGGLDATNGATFEFTLGSISDQLSLGSGTFAGSSFDSGLIFDFTLGSGFETGTAYTLLTAGAFNSFDYSDLAAITPEGYTLDTSYGTNGFLIDDTLHTLSVQLVAVPEPSSVMLVVFAAACLILTTRRRRLNC